jgi:hypothetical protein
MSSCSLSPGGARSKQIAPSQLDTSPSLEPGSFAKLGRIGNISKVLDYTVSLRTLASYGLALKIDVQGHELGVLRGM